MHTQCTLEQYDTYTKLCNIHHADCLLCPHSLDGCSSALSKEVQLEFTRSMNRILFDKTVTSQPGTFPFVTLPDPHVEKVPERGMYFIKHWASNRCQHYFARLQYTWVVRGVIPRWCSDLDTRHGIQL